MIKTKKLISLALLLGMFGATHAQQVKYNVINNKPYNHFLNVEISPFDFRLQDGNIFMGPSLMAEIRPVARVMAEAQIASFVFTPAEGTMYSGLKKAGGLSIDAGGAFTFMRKGINLTANKGDETPIPGHFRLKTSGNVETFINFPFNRVVERSVRGGGYYYDYPAEEKTHRAVGGYAGLGKTIVKGATINAEGYGELTRYMTSGYYIDVLFGTSDYAMPINNETGGSGMGVRFGYKMVYVGGLFPLSTTFEFGKLPGSNGGLMRLKFAGNILSGKQHYEGDYKFRKKAKRKIPALIQSL